MNITLDEGVVTYEDGTQEEWVSVQERDELVEALKDILVIIDTGGDARDYRNQIAAALSRWGRKGAEQNEIRLLGPGKFSAVVDQYVWQVSLDSGGCDEEVSHPDGMGWAGLFRNGRTVFQDNDPNLEKLTEMERELVQTAAIIILQEDSQGFVTITYHTDEAEGEEEWSQIEADFPEDGEEGEYEDEDAERED